MAAAVPLSTFVPRGAIEWLATTPEQRHRPVEGSLLFVDLSGFTALSERLARLGREGAEEVTAVVNTVFNGLLAVAYADGGTLLKFGGDALLLLYEGEDHAAHAVRAGARMRTHLRGLSPLGSSAGNVELRMTIGVHSGRVDQFLVGRDHRDLVLAGPAVSAVVRAEGAASAGEVLVTPETAHLLDDACTEVRPDGLHRLRREPDAGAFVPPVIKQVPEGVDVGQLLGGAVRDRLVAGIGDGEHRQAVIAFLRFRGSDELLAAEGPAALAEALEELATTIQEAAATYGVSWLSSDIDAGGGKVILLAGVPTASEFDGEQMLRAVGDVARRGTRLPVQVGVHRGRVFAGVVGPHFRLTYTVIGDAVNLAARVMGRADPGQVLATPEVLNRSQVRFRTTPLPPFTVKGKARPVRAHAVGEATSRRVQARTGRLPLVGRDAELAELLAALDRGTSGAGQVVVLAGEAGLGKSRLVAELEDRRPDVAVVAVSAQRYERNTAYHVVGRLLRQLLALPDEGADGDAVTAAVVDRAPELAPWTPLVGDALGVEVADTPETAELQARFRAERVAEVVGDLVVRCLPDPTVLVLDDAHWMDRDSLRVVLHLAQVHLPHQPWLVLATTRAAPTPRPGIPAFHTIELGPLPPEAVHELTLAAAEQGMIALDRVDRLAERASGNPLFLEELVTSGSDTLGELPDSLETLVESRIDRLAAPDRERLRLAAVLGIRIDLRLLEHVAGPEVARDTDGWARLHDFLDPTEDGGFRFRHALVHDAAYGALPYRRRRELHARAVEGLLRRHGDHEEEAAELLALHAYNAGHWRQAWRWNRMAGDRARERHANPTAANNYRRAIEVAHHAGVDPTDLAHVHETLAEVLELAGGLREAAEALARARRTSPDHDLPRLFRLEGRLRERLGSYTQAVRWYRRGLRALAEVEDPVEEAMLHAGLAIVRLDQGRPRDALEHAVEALRAAESNGDESALARAHFVLAWAHDDLGDGRGEQHRRTAIARYEALGDQRSLVYLHNNAGAAAFHRGAWEEAIDHYTRAADIVRRVGDRPSHALLLGNIGEIRSNQGRYDEADEHLAEGAGIARAAGHAMATGYTAMLRGRTAARRGDHDAAEALLEQARAELDALGARRLHAEAETALAELALFRGDPAAAVVHAASLLDDHDRPGRSVWAPAAWRVRAVGLLLLDDHEGAARAAEEAHRAAVAAADRYQEALADVVTALVADREVDPAATAALEALGVVVPPTALVAGPADGVRAAPTVVS